MKISTIINLSKKPDFFICEIVTFEDLWEPKTVFFVSTYPSVMCHVLLTTGSVTPLYVFFSYCPLPLSGNFVLPVGEYH